MITVLRLGHRIFRDQRISSHVFLVARAFGADKGIYTGEKDGSLEDSVARAVEQWGGKFDVMHANGWKQATDNFDGIKVHLTVYGMPFQDKMAEIRKKCKGKDLMVIVGGEKVRPEVYQAADWNIAVTSQPHSEVAALALFLHEMFEGRELGKDFKGAKLRVVPQERGKKVISRG